MWDLIGGLASGIGNYLAAQEQRKAAEAASQAQLAGTNRALDFQRDQFGQSLGFQQGLLGQAGAQGQQQLGQLQSLFAPFTAAGGQGLSGLNQFAQAGLGSYTSALQGQQALSGALGAGAQQQAIAGIQGGPLFGSLAKQGEDAILQNASATGGLRGGNTQGALAQFRPQLLSQLIQQQFANLGGLGALGAQGAQGFGQLGQLGQSGAAGQAQGGLGVLQGQLGLAGQVGANVGTLSNAYGNSVTDLFGQQGSAQAGNALAQGRANAGLFSGIGNNFNQFALMNQLRGWGGIGQSPNAQSRYPTPSDFDALSAMQAVY